MLLVTLDFRIVNLTTNQTFGIKDGVFRVRVEGVLGGVPNTVRMNTSLELQLVVGRQSE